MIEKDNIIKIEKWFKYYETVYNIFKLNILTNSNLSMQLSFFNSVPQDGDEEYGKGQIIKLELFNNNNVIEGISLKTVDSEEQLFQYAWMLVVNHFIDENYDKNSKIKIHGFDNSTRSFKYLISDIKRNNETNGEPIIRANFTLTYNKQEYDEMLHHLVLNHNNYHDNKILLENVRNYILDNVEDKTSEDLNISINKSRKVYEHLIRKKYYSK